MARKRFLIGATLALLFGTSVEAQTVGQTNGLASVPVSGSDQSGNSIRVPAAGVVLLTPTGSPYTAGGGGGGSTSQTATAAAPTYAEGSTTNPLSSDLSGYTRVRAKQDGTWTFSNTGFNALQGGAANSASNPFYFAPSTGASFPVTGTFWPYTLNGDGGVPSHVTNFPTVFTILGSGGTPATQGSTANGNSLSAYVAPATGATFPVSIADATLKPLAAQTGFVHIGEVGIQDTSVVGTTTCSTSTAGAQTLCTIDTAALGSNAGFVSWQVTSAGVGNTLAPYASEDGVAANATGVVPYIVVTNSGGTANMTNGVAAGVLNSVYFSPIKSRYVVFKLGALTSGTFTLVYSLHVGDKNPNNVYVNAGTITLGTSAVTVGAVFGAATTTTPVAFTGSGTANTFTSALASAAARRDCTIYSATAFSVAPGASPAANIAIPVAAGGTFKCSSGSVVMSDQINVSSATASAAYVVWSN